MRVFATRKAGVITMTAAAATIMVLAAGASAASIVVGAVSVDLGSSFPDMTTWALMLVSFGMIGLGVRSRKRSVVLA